MDLKLQTLVDYQPMTQDQLISALEQYAGELAHRVTMLETNRCLDELERSCIAMGNAMVVYDYVNKHGITNHACELLADGDMVAMEGVVDSAKEAVVKFVRWLCEMVKKICKSIVDLFRDNDEVSTLLSGDSSKIDDLLKDADPNATTDKKLTKPNIEWLNKSLRLFLNNIGGEQFVALLTEVSNGSAIVDANTNKPFDVAKEMKSYFQTNGNIDHIFDRMDNVGKLKEPTGDNEEEYVRYLTKFIEELFKGNSEISALTEPDKRKKLLEFRKHIAAIMKVIVEYGKFKVSCADIIKEVKKIKKTGTRDRGVGANHARNLGRRNKQ